MLGDKLNTNDSSHAGIVKKMLPHAASLAERFFPQAKHERTNSLFLMIQCLRFKIIPVSISLPGATTAILSYIIHFKVTLK